MQLPLQEMRKFVAPEIVFGNGALSLAGMYAKNLGARKVLVVTDEGVQRAGWTGKAIQHIVEEDLSYALFSGVTPNPRSEEVMSGASLYHTEHCDAIVAVGGGSPVDCAKGIGTVVSNGGNILDYEGVDRIAKPIPPLICIPTTAGAAADVSQFAIISDTARKVKIALISKTLVPDLALIDAETTTTMSAELTACTGLDALTHAVEAFVSNARFNLTDLYALDAITIIYNNLLHAIEEPENLTYRTAMMLACLEAGIAFSNASLGAVHAMAHSLGGLLDLPHGACNAMLLEWIVDFNFSSAAEQYSRIGSAIGLDMNAGDEDSGKKKLTDAIHDFRIRAGINKTIGALGVNLEHIRDLAANAISDPCMVTNPVTPAQEDIERIYERAL
ncbi:MAG: alcohol dehydrogenase-like regulatory protein ErcA [Candidatus Xenobiia bacterium LiM19]